MCSLLFALWERRVFYLFWKMCMKRCELNGCERHREVLRGLNLAPEAQVALAEARGGACRVGTGARGGGGGGAGGKHTWEVRESLRGSPTYPFLYQQRPARQISLFPF